MFCIKEPFEKNSPWILSHSKDEKLVSISTDTVKDIKNHHIQGIDFLYQSFKKQFKGAILNEEEHMNMQLQVSAFLNAMFNYTESKLLMLVIAPDHHIVKWHYHLTKHAGLKVQIVTPKTCPEDFDEESCLALLLSFSQLKLAEYLVDYEFFSIIIDSFDEVASKLVIRKLQGQFNIGLTQRNFYINPDQKMQWTMLNWSNPRCVGKLGEFYTADDDNFANFRDNYRHWWFRLTWSFCDTFKKPTDEEEQEYVRTLSDWSASNNLKNFNISKTKSSRKRKNIDIIGGNNPKGIAENDTEKKTSDLKKNHKIEANITNKVNNNGPIEEVVSNETSSQSSADTIIYEIPSIAKQRDSSYVQLPSMDENPILNSIIRNFEKSPEPITPQHSTFTYTTVKYSIEEPNCSKAFLEEEESVLLSIINDKVPAVPSMEDFNRRKEEIRSQIFNEQPCTSKSFIEEHDSQFLKSLIDPDIPGMIKNSDGAVNKSGDDIDAILRETEVLLKE